MTDNKQLTIWQRLIAAQSEMKNPVKNGRNPAFKKDGKPSEYATLDDMLAAVRPPLAAHGLFITIGTEVRESGSIVCTLRVFDGAGDSVTLAAFPVNGQTAQQLGSSETYAMRYSLQSAFALAGMEDDDGNAASATKPKADRQPQQPNAAYQPAPQKREEVSGTRKKLIEDLTSKMNLAVVVGLPKEDISAWAKKEFKATAPKDMTDAQLCRMIAWLDERYSAIAAKNIEQMQAEEDAA